MQTFLACSSRYRHPLAGLLLCLFLLRPPSAVWAASEVSFAFTNEDIQTVIHKVGQLTGTTFLFDPEQIKGKITILPPKMVSPQEALALLQSALTLHGYAMVPRAEGTWIVPAEKASPVETVIEVIPLQYARAEELAYTLAWIAPYGVRIVPYYPTNSLILSGDAQAVEALVGLIRGKEKEGEKHSPDPREDRTR